MFFQQISSGVKIGIFLSSLLHAGLGGGLYYTLAIETSPTIVAELDLSMTSLLPVPPAPPPPPVAGPGAVPVAEATPGPTRTVAKKQAAAFPLPPPKPEVLMPSEISDAPSEILETPEIPSEEEAAVSSASVSSEETLEADGSQSGEVVAGSESGEPGGIPTDVQGGEFGGTPGGLPGGVPGGSGGVSGRYLSASQVAELPRWIGNHIGPSDYPRRARRKGKDGQVLLSVFIDEAGRVRDVRLLQGSDDILNEVALRKVREARFTPAYNGEGQPVACKVTLPIRFQLQ